MGLLAVFGWPDWIVVAAYFVTVCVVGIVVARRTKASQTGDADYFLGNRSMPTWALAVSIVTTSLSAATFVGVPDAAYKGDLTYLSLSLGAVLAVFIVAIVFVPRLYAAGTVTIYGYLAERYGETSRLAVSAAFIVGRMLASGARLFLAAIPLAMLMFGAESGALWQMLTAILLIGVVGTFYTVIGGVRAVVWVDAIQLLIVLLTAAVTVGILLHRIPLGPAELFSALSSSNSAATGTGKLLVLDLSTDPTRAYTLWTALFAATFLSTAAYGVDHDLAQRFLISRSARKGAWSVIASQGISIAVISLFLFIGLLLYVFYDRPDLMGAPTAAGPPGGKGAYPWFLLNELPTVVSGFCIAGFFAIAQGSMDSAINAVAASVVADVYVPLRRRLGLPEQSAQSHERTSRWAVALVGAGLTGFAVLCAITYDPKNQTLLDFALGVMTFAFTGMLGVFLTALLTRRGNNASVVAALVVGAASVALMQNNVLPVWTERLFGVPVRLAWPWWMTIGTVLAFATCVAGSGKHRPAAQA